MVVHIHQVEEVAFGKCFFGIGKIEHIFIYSLKLLLVAAHGPAVEVSAAYALHRPVVEDGGASVFAAEALAIHAALAELLTCIEHERILLEQNADNHSRHAAHTVACEEVARYALFVVVLEEVQHIAAYVVGFLPLVGDVAGTPVSAYHIAHTVIHSDFVVEPVETCTYVVAVLCRVVDLADELQLGVGEPYFVGCPCPEGSRHHLCHVAAERIDALGCPEKQYRGHLVPRVGDGAEVL